MLSLEEGGSGDLRSAEGHVPGWFSLGSGNSKVTLRETNKEKPQRPLASPSSFLLSSPLLSSSLLFSPFFRSPPVPLSVCLLLLSPFPPPSFIPPPPVSFAYLDSTNAKDEMRNWKKRRSCMKRQLILGKGDKKQRM